jgi:DNA-binding NarL/FixJ family response regulator
VQRVLVVDDHEGFRAAARALLEADGFVVVAEAATGADGLLAAARTVPHVVLLDVQLPDMDGFEVARALAELDGAATIVLVSSRSATTYGEKIAAAPARGFITKADLTGDALREILGHP